VSTVLLHAERMNERSILIELVSCLRRQNAELDELQEMHATAEGKLEEREEKLAEAIEDISKANALGAQGKPFAQLARIRAELLRLNNVVEEWERYKRLVRLCMEGEVLSGGLTQQAMQLIYAEVCALKEQELPF
jgi:hypothetical protein